MTTTVTAPKIHHFIKLARTRIEQVKMALSGVPEGLPEYRKAPLSSGTIAYSTMRTRLNGARVNPTIVQEHGLTATGFMRSEKRFDQYAWWQSS